MSKQMMTTLSAAATLALCPLAQAQESDAGKHALSANIGVFSQYVFRGLSQTNERPALQGGFDYAHASGFYAGSWLSNISWFSDLNAGTSTSLEWDAYLGMKRSWAAGLTTDIGYLRYEYPGDFAARAPGVLKPNTDEVYAGVAWKWAAFKYSYAVSELFGVPDSTGSYYVDLTVTVPLPRSFALALHAGRQTFRGGANDELLGYEDYRATLSYGFGAGWTASAGVTTSTAEDAGYTIGGKNIGGDQFILAITRAL